MNANPGTLAFMMIGASDTDGNSKITFDEVMNAEGPKVLSDLIGKLISK